MVDRRAIETEIVRTGINPNPVRLSPSHIDAQVADVEYQIFFGIVTVCVIRLVNGFSVVGHSAPISEDNFNEEMGKKIAYEKAIDKVWELEGYRVKSEETRGD